MGKKYLAWGLAAAMLFINAPMIDSCASERPKEIQSEETIQAGSLDASGLEEGTDTVEEALSVSNSDALFI